MEKIRKKEENERRGHFGVEIICEELGQGDASSEPDAKPIVIPRKSMRFNIDSVSEQKLFMPFESRGRGAQSFFAEWCAINDSIVPEFVSRGEWEEMRAAGVLQKRPDGKQTLYVPEDLQLWEVIGVIEAVDRDTYAAKPERQGTAKEKLSELGKKFKSAGVYVARHLDSIGEGRGIAAALASEFYDYGNSLVSRKQSKEILDIDEVKSLELTEAENEKAARFILGDDLYESRMARAEKAAAAEPGRKDEIREAELQKALSQFFRASAKAFELKQRSENKTLGKNTGHLMPWQKDTPFHNAFLSRVEKTMEQNIEVPKRELNMTMFRRGLEKLVSEMGVPEDAEAFTNSLFRSFGFDLPAEQRKLADTIGIKELRAELEAVRQFGDLVKIGVKEREVANKIQQGVSLFKYKEDSNNPSEMIATRSVNCVGASMLGGVLLREVGLNYLVGTLPYHSVLFLVASDGGVEWRDMLHASFCENLSDDMIDGKKKDGTPLRVADITAFSQRPATEGLMFDLDEKYRSKMGWVQPGQRMFVGMFSPEYGQYVQVLNNMGSVFHELGLIKQSAQAYRQAIAVAPKFAYAHNGLGNALLSENDLEGAISEYRQAAALDPSYSESYNGLGNALNRLGRGEDAILAYRQAIAVNPQNPFSYFGLGRELHESGKKEEAVSVYRRAIELDSKSTSLYYGLGSVLSDLGRKEEAIEAYQKCVDLADEHTSDPWVGRAKKSIEQLKR